MRIKPSAFLRFTLAVFVGMLTSAGRAGAATEKILHTFEPYLNGSSPRHGLVADAAGNLYGTTYYGGSSTGGTVFKLTRNSHGGWTEHVLYSFTGAADGAYPEGGVILDKAHNLYGTTSYGGTNNCGTVYKLTPGASSWTISTLYSFTGGADGRYPNGNLVFDGNGNLYGAAQLGGDSSCYFSGCGTVFELVPSGGNWTLSVLHAFSNQYYYEGENPASGLIFDHAGNLYGTTWTGGYGSSSQFCNSGCGTVFKLKPSGGNWTESVLYSFNGGTDGANPASALTVDQAGNLYVATTAGGSLSCSLAAGCGTIIKLAPGKLSWTESVLYAFTGGTDGFSPESNLIFDKTGNLYGATLGNGYSACGAVFQLTPSSGTWTPSVLHSFTGATDGCQPDSVTLTASGNIFGTARSSGPGANGLVFELTPANGSWKETAASAFFGTDGGWVMGTLAFDNAGSLYGLSGGGRDQLGAIVKLVPNSQGGWTESVPFSFTDSSLGNGPTGGLIFDQQGNLYGTMAYGGQYSSLCTYTYGCGTVFKLTPSGNGWSESVIHFFSGADGGSAQGSLVFDAAGDLYGTTNAGGAGVGTVFKLSPSSGGAWTETVLYTFTGGIDGSAPWGGLVFDQAGNLYGATLTGGAYGYGTIFKLAPSSGGAWTETVLYAFSNGQDGRSPQGPLVFDAAGNLYGTTTGPAYRSEPGTVFRLSPSGSGWTLNVLLSVTDGESLGPVILDPAGNLYGTTLGYSYTVNGTVFELTPGSGGWTETVLHAFSGYPADGSFPNDASLTRDAAGNLYGGTGLGGAVFSGIVYEIVP